ncbi:MAG: PAS domain S-box protein [Candidatus Omnitrophica bacterium]|nr:PAS domain S-box protein [Candidatus Omnitrophota bacterium]
MLSFTNYKKSLEAARLSQLQDFAALREEGINAFIAGLKSDIEIVQCLYNIKRNLPILSAYSSNPQDLKFVSAKEMLDGQLPRMQKLLKLMTVALLNTDGKVVYSSDSEHYPKRYLQLLYDSQQKIFIEGKHGVYISDVLVNKKKNNKPEILVSAPAFDSKGVMIGVIVFEVDMAPIYDFINNVAGLGTTGEVLIGKRIGNKVFFLNPLRNDRKSVFKRSIPLGDKLGRPIQQAVQGKTGVGQLIDYRGKKVIAAWRYIPSLQWGMVAKIDADEALADVSKLKILVFFILIFVSFLVSLLAFFIAQYISGPLKKLSEGAQKIGRGDLDHKIGMGQKDEIGQLSRVFDKMAEDLKKIMASRDDLNKEIVERKLAQEKIHSLLDQFELLAMTAENLLRADNPKKVINSLCQAVMERLGCHVFFNFFVDKKAGRLHLNAFAGIPEQEALQIEWLDYGVAVCGCAARDGCRIIAEHIPTTDDPRTELVKSFGVKAYACHPILGEGQEVLGTLSFGTRSRETFTDEDLSLMKAVTGQVAVAMIRMRIQEDLRDNESRLNAVLEAGEFGIWGLDIKTRKAWRSLRHDQTFGYKELLPEWTYDMFLSHVLPEDRENVNNKFGKAIVEGTNWDFECRIKRGDGVVRWIWAQGKPLLDVHHKVTQISGFVKDITEHKKIEKEALEARKRLETLMDALPVGVSFSDDQTCQRITGNAAVLAQFEVGEKDNLSASAPDNNASGRKLQFFNEGRQISESELPLQRAVKENRVIPAMELEVVLPSGKHWFAMVSGAPVCDDHGKVLGGVAVTVDITDRKKNEETLRQKEERLNELLQRLTYHVDNSPLAVIEWGPDMRLIRWSGIAEQMFGWKSQEVLGKRMDDFHWIYHEDEAKVDDVSSQLQAGLKLRVFSANRNYRKDGAVIYCEWYNSSLFDSSGKLRSILSLVLDVTAQKQAEEVLKRDKKTLEELVKKNSQELLETQLELVMAKRLSDIGTLAATVAHELRNPLAAIHMAAYNLYRKAQNPQLEKHFNVIEKKIDESDQIINNLLFYSRIRSPQYQEVCLGDILEECIPAGRSRHAKEKINLVRDYELAGKMLFQADPVQLKEVFSNLINNAFDAMRDKRGDIKIIGDVEGQFLRIQVIDTGIGIEEDVLQMVFDPFFTTKAQGTGLGLTVCKQIIAAHDGSIDMTSQKGQGTTVTVRLPFSKGSHV